MLEIQTLPMRLGIAKAVEEFGSDAAPADPTLECGRMLNRVQFDEEFRQGLLKNHAC